MAETLRDLLMQAKEKRGVTSGRALADLTSDRRDKIDRTQVNSILKGTYKSRPSHGLIRAVAWLAVVDDEVAYRAARVPIPGPPFAEELPPDVDYLGPPERRAVITIIQAFLGLIGEGGAEDDSPPATKKPGSGPGSAVDNTGTDFGRVLGGILPPNSLKRSDPDAEDENAEGNVNGA